MVIERLTTWRDVMSRIDVMLAGDYIDGFAIEYISPLTQYLVVGAPNLPSSSKDLDMMAEQLPTTFPSPNGFKILERDFVAFGEVIKRIVRIRVITSPS
jgi:hypothetical protein